MAAMLIASTHFYRLDKKALEARLPAAAGFEALDSLLGVKTAAEHFRSAFRLPCLAGVDDKRLFATVCELALEALQDPALQDMQPLVPGATRTFTARQCSGILANAMLGNVVDLMAERKHEHNKGGLSFIRHLRFPEGVYVHKTAALLLYFEARRQASGTDDDAREVRFEHHLCPTDGDFAALVRQHADAVLASDGHACTLHSDVMEAPPAEAFVNFANANFGYGGFIPSCTQEEILQMACPEFNVGMLLLGRMGEDEVVNVRGCRRYSTYAGYLRTYTCTGSLVAGAASPVVLHDVLTLDACTTQHFRRDRQLRDLRKAYASFAALGPGAVVSTGRWGCGVFGGLPAHKFAQQAVAARLAGVRLRFSTFGTPDGCDVVLGALQASGASVPFAFEALLRCADRRAFEESFMPMLRWPATAAAAGEAEGEQRACGMV